jgi:hypothetical protein
VYFVRDKKLSVSLCVFVRRFIENVVIHQVDEGLPRLLRGPQKNT